jgi:isopentenyl phosphate kinase
LSAKPVVLKLGGSVITHKDKLLTANFKAINRIAGEISSANVAPLIVVHGGGSFGHHFAKLYAIKNGYAGNAWQALGFAETHQAMVKLNRLVVDALIHRQIPAVAVSPSSCLVTKKGRIETLLDEPLNKLLRMGFVPVLYGDAVFDSDLGFTILSGDQLITLLAIRYNAERIIVGLDVKGLCVEDPHLNPSAKLIRHINLEELKRGQMQIGGARVTDVTGGMLAKIMELTPAIENGISVQILNARKSNNVYKALKNAKVTGTIIAKDENKCQEE